VNQDPSDNQIPEFSDDFDLGNGMALSNDLSLNEEKKSFLNRLKGLFKKSGSDDAFGQINTDTDDPFVLQEREDAMFAKRRRIMGFIFIAVFLGLIGLGTAAYTIDWSSPEPEHVADTDANSHDSAGSKKTLTDAIAHMQNRTADTSNKGEHGQKVSNQMPVISGPEDLQKALIRPPAAALPVPHNPDMDRRKQALTALTPEQLAAQQAQKTPEQLAAQQAQKESGHEAPVTAAQTSQQPTANTKPEPQMATPSVVTQKTNTNFVIPALPAPRTDFNKKAQPPEVAALPKLPEDQKIPAFQKAPQPELQTKSPAGKTIPTVSPDGRRAWKVYAQPYEAKQGSPQIAIILQDLGLSKTLTTAAVLRMPPEVTLSFSPYASNLNAQLVGARQNGHETLLNIGLESSSFPDEDPGPEGLFTALSVMENTKRLETSLSKASVYLGVVANGGDRFVASENHFTALMERMKDMGLLYVAPDAAVAPYQMAPQKPARTVADIHIRQNTFRGQVVAYLRAAEDLARQSGRAVVLIDASPLALDVLSQWFPELPKRAFQLAPISSMVKE